MSFRKEEKLLINTNQVFDFKKWLNSKGFMKIYKDRNVNSLYFENNSNKMFLDSEEGTVPRKKIRVRNYPDGDDKKYYLEIKNSSVEGRFKTRKIISVPSFDKYKNVGIFDDQYGVCVPNYYVSYLREYCIIDDVRISLDNNLVYTNFKNKLVHKDLNSIVEIKTSIKKNLDDLVKLFPFQRIRFSKYCFAVDNLRK